MGAAVARLLGDEQESARLAQGALNPGRESFPDRRRRGARGRSSSSTSRSRSSAPDTDVGLSQRPGCSIRVPPGWRVRLPSSDWRLAFLALRCAIRFTRTSGVPRPQWEESVLVICRRRNKCAKRRIARSPCAAAAVMVAGLIGIATVSVATPAGAVSCTPSASVVCITTTSPLPGGTVGSADNQALASSGRDRHHHLVAQARGQLRPASVSTRRAPSRATRPELERSPSPSKRRTATVTPPRRLRCPLTVARATTTVAPLASPSQSALNQLKAAYSAVVGGEIRLGLAHRHGDSHLQPSWLAHQRDSV